MDRRRRRVDGGRRRVDGWKEKGGRRRRVDLRKKVRRGKDEREKDGKGRNGGLIEGK